MPRESFLPFDVAPYLAQGHAPTPIAGAVLSGGRVFLSAASALGPDGGVVGLGDAAAQADAAIDRIEAALKAAGGSLSDVAKLTVWMVDRAHREPVHAAIGRRLGGVHSVVTDLIVGGLVLPELMLQIDAEAVVGAPVARHRTTVGGAMVAATDDEVFIQGLTGCALEGGAPAAPGRRVADAAAQAELALGNLGRLLGECESGPDAICKLTVCISDRAYRPAVYPVIGRHLADVRPVSTGLIVAGFARPETLFAIDVRAVRTHGTPHTRIRPYHSNAASYGLARQSLGCAFCMAVRAGRHIRLRGQTGVDLQERMQGLGDPAAQAAQAMENVGVLLGESGAAMADVAKATVFVTDRAHLAPAAEVVLGRLSGVVPAFSAVVVKGLASPELLMEVDVTAVCEAPA